MSSVATLPGRVQVLEFFAGVGLARMGLESVGAVVTWANDISPDKQAMYEKQFEDEPSHFVLGDIGQIRGDSLPKGASIAWASSPCTDLSLAGNRTGLRGTESSAFYEFIRILDELGDDRPDIAVLENVVGLATSHGGDDLAAAIRAFNSLGYSADVITLDARRFVPQSRPRLFIVASTHVPEQSEGESLLRPSWLDPVFSDCTLRMHKAALPEPPELLTTGFSKTAERLPADDVRWWAADRVEAFVSSMSPVQVSRLNELKKSRTVTYRTAYRRTRNGVAVWEMRPDDISGCLRTARGGSSKQAVVKLGGGKIAVRWMTGAEYARLMGADDYTLTWHRDSQVHFAFGDAVAVPAVGWLAENYLIPLARGTSLPSQELSRVV